MAVAPSNRRAIPKPANRLVPSERERPRIGRLDRRQEGLGAALHELGGHIEDRGHEEEERTESQPDHCSERALPVRGRRPGEPG